jgi:Amino acid synthesis
MDVPVRKLYEISEDVHSEGARAVEPPTRIAATMAVVANPLVGRWAENLTPLIDLYSETLGALLAERCAGQLGGPVEAFGKGALVGLDGEIEHGSAIIHTLRFGSALRQVAGDAASYVPSAEKRAAAGATLDLALKHVNDVTLRSHHQTFEVRIPDAPRPDEIVIAVALASSGRPQSRLAPLQSELAGLPA